MLDVRRTLLLGHLKSSVVPFGAVIASESTCQGLELALAARV